MLTNPNPPDAPEPEDPAKVRVRTTLPHVEEGSVLYLLTPSLLSPPADEEMNNLNSDLAGSPWKTDSPVRPTTPFLVALLLTLSVPGSLYVYGPNRGSPIFFAVAFAASAVGHIWQCW